MMVLIVERTLDSTRSAERFLSAIGKATERGQSLAYEIREQVTASRRMFSNDGVGQDYLSALDLSRAPLHEGARLPVIEEAARLGPDQPGVPSTGNILFFVGETDATGAIADPVAQTVRYIDTYRFVCCYPRLAPRAVVTDAARSNALDLVVWKSVEFPNYKQLMAISDPVERANVVADLYERHGHRMAWDPTGAVGDGFYDLGASGTIAGAPNPDPMIDEDLDESGGGRLVYANVQLARSDNADPRRKAIFTMDDPNTWRPDGFEVKIVGASGSRQVWMHLVVAVQAERGRVAVQPNTLVASVRDL